MAETKTQNTIFNDWYNKSVTFMDYSRILGRLYDDIGNKSVSPQILHHLYLLLLSSKKYFPENIPGDVVTMNSRITLLLGNNQKRTIHIVFPNDEKAPEDVSIYSSLGSACLGSDENSSICYQEGDTINKVKIEKIEFQPEKEKMFFL